MRPSRLLLLPCALFAACCAFAADARRSFDLPAGDAAETLRRFAQQAGREIVYPAQEVRGRQTNTVRGELPVAEALQQLLAGTELIAELDQKTGAYAVRKGPVSPKALRVAAPTGNGRPQPKVSPVATDETLMLSAFEVSEDVDKSYGALNSNSATAFRVELKKLPLTADVFGEAFMNDVGLNTIEQVVQNFSPGAGYAASTPDTYAMNGQFLDRNNTSTMSIRGLSAPSVQVNGFFPTGGTGMNGSGISSNFSTERVEVISGPQSLLYGVSGSGGVINMILKQARFDRPGSGSLKFQVDQYGNKLGQVDYGIGDSRLAVRVSLLNQTLGGRRVFIGGPLKGGYLQLAAKPTQDTVVRYSLDKSSFDRVNAIGALISLQALNAANDARNGQALRWLLATGQTQAAADGKASGTGNIMNGALNWDNIDSLAGAMYGETQRHSLQLLTAETRWNSWLSTQASIGYRTEERRKVGNAGVTFLAPNVVANPTGTWAIGMGSGLSACLFQPIRQKVARFSALATNDLFGGRVHSQTVAGVDFTRTDGENVFAALVQADGDFNPIRSGVAANNGFTLIPTVYWPVANGPVQQPLWGRNDSRITYKGVNYVRQVTNFSVDSLVSPTNPMGLTGTGSGNNQKTVNIQSGIYGANFSDWLGGRLTTLLGVRLGKAFLRGLAEAANPPSVKSEALSTYTGFNAGASYALTSWLRPYVQVSTNYVPSSATADPYGNYNKTASGIGEEAGLKLASPTNAFSGSLGVYRSSAKNEIISNPTVLTSDINYPGLNGRLGAPGNAVNADRETQGLQLAVTAAPTKGWRMRFAAATIAATIGTDRSYAQVYNDQFYANNQRQVTYRDGTVVYVLPTATQVANAATAGASPLTIDMMNDSRNRYYANPIAIAGAINPNSAAATILKTVDPVHGPILTGAVGLPISAMQIAPNPLSPPPGTIVLMRSGDRVTGSPRYSTNFTNVYTIREGWVKGLRFGGTVVAKWKNGSYYYYPNTVSDPNTRALFAFPDLLTVSGILGYERRYRGFTLSTQLNISNMFNKYHVVSLPSYLNGWAGPNNAIFDEQPRMYVWSSTISF
jgi:outer membrane receptor protein involved in Fe transport